jgi:type I restriction-modification system DNA methylase subunit
MEQGYAGDLLEPYREHIQSSLFHGFDFDVTMLRIAAMNLMLHGVDNPAIDYHGHALQAASPEDGTLGTYAENPASTSSSPNLPFKGTPR